MGVEFYRRLTTGIVLDFNKLYFSFIIILQRKSCVLATALMDRWYNKSLQALVIGPGQLHGSDRLRVRTPCEKKMTSSLY